MAARGVKARFIEPMLLLKTERLPEGAGFLFELKFDDLRAIGFKTGGKVYPRSRNWRPKYFSGGSLVSTGAAQVTTVQ